MALNRDKIVWNGFEALKSIGDQAAIPSLASAAKDLSDRLGRSARGGPIVAFIATRGESAAPDDVIEAMDHFVESLDELPAEYEQPAFQCLSDYRKATGEGTPRLLAGFVLAVCLVERLLSIKIGK